MMKPTGSMITENDQLALEWANSLANHKNGGLGQRRPVPIPFQHSTSLCHLALASQVVRADKGLDGILNPADLPHRQHKRMP